MLIGLSAGTQQGVEAVLTYLLVYVVTTIGAFLFVMQLRDADGAMVESIPAYAGLSKRQPGLAAAMAVFLFSLAAIRSEEHTSELQSLMRISYAVFCLKKKTQQKAQHSETNQV